MILQQRNGRRKCTKTKVKNSSFRNKYDRVETEDPEDVIAQPKNRGGLISECIMYYHFFLAKLPCDLTGKYLYIFFLKDTLWPVLKT